MNEETDLPAEVSTDPSSEPVSESTAAETYEASDGAVTEEIVPFVTEVTIWEDFSGAAFEETVAETTEPVLTVEVIDNGVADIVHAGLFGNFLICGTLIGVTLLRDRYGS